MTGTGNGEPPGRQDLLADVLAGTRSPDDADVRKACQDPAFALLLGELQDLRERVGRAMDAERGALAAPPSAIDERMVAQARSMLALRERPGRVLRGPWRALLAVAAALLLGTGAVLLLWPRALPTDHRLGDDYRIEVAADYAVVSWQGSSGALWFKVRVFDGSGAEIDHSDLLKTNTWSSKQSARWPDRVTVKVALVDVEDVPQRAPGMVEVDRTGTRR